MIDDVDGFEHAYVAADIVLGRGKAGQLEALLAERGVDRVLVVCGSNVGANDALIDPLRDGLGNRLAGVFDGTTTDKSVMPAYEALDRLEPGDGLLAVGGGSSIDVARAIALLAADFRRPDDLRRQAAETGRIGAPDDATLPFLGVVPTTFAGADLSMGGSVTFEDGTVAGMNDRRLMPDLALYDPALVETTPASVLRGSAMNGLDKGVETCYARTRTPITDATAVRGLRYLDDALVEAIDRVERIERDAPVDVDATPMARALTGLVLVQYGTKRPGVSTLGPIHAFGHGISGAWPVQQGVAHAAVAPAVVRDVLAADSAGLDRLAEGFGVASDAASVVAALRAVRDDLDLPSRLRDLEGADRDDLRAVAEATHADGFMSNGPAGYDPSVEDLTDLLAEAW